MCNRDNFVFEKSRKRWSIAFVRGEKNKLLLGTAGSEANYGISARAKKVGMKASSKVLNTLLMEAYKKSLVSI